LSPAIAVRKLESWVSFDENWLLNKYRIAFQMSSDVTPLPPRALILCLSGGGFRAMLFHLGVVRYLAAINELSRVNAIFAVSGGSILAADLALRWDEYLSDFAKAEMVLKDFAGCDLRGRLVRKWLLAGNMFWTASIGASFRTRAVVDTSV
jgi:predicted acylesterase/phospholipase RssA